MESQIKERLIKCNPKVRFNQCDVLQNLTIITHIDNENEEAIFSKTILSYGIVISQECDLEHDYNNRNNSQATTQDKYLPSIIVLPAYLSEHFKEGTHRGTDIAGQKWDSANFNRIKQNNNARFHFLEQDVRFQSPSLIIDFKHIYAINRNLLYKQIDQVYLASVAEIYRESISHRYSHYLSRIGLPEIN